jgi:type VI secretion system VasD/TssJ family lipoprotein
MNNTLMNFAVLASTVALCGGCAGCAQKLPPPTPQPPSPCTTPEPIRLLLTASPRLNPDENGQSLATTVRIYQLRATGKLVESSIDRLLDNDRAVLAEDLVAAQELTLYPGERAAPVMVRGEGAAYVAVVAMFRRPDGPSWRAIRQLLPPNPQHCHGTAATPQAMAAALLRFTLEDNRVEMR